MQQSKLGLRLAAGLSAPLTLLFAGLAVASLLAGQGPGALGVYFALLLIACYLALSEGGNWPWWQACRQEARWLLGLFALALVARFHSLGAAPLGLDEDMAGGRALQGNLQEAAALLQQPPLFVHLLWASLQALGRDAFALRFFPALFGALAVPLAYFLLIRLHGRRLFAMAGALMLLADPLLAGLSREARPYSLSACLFLLYLLELTSPLAHLARAGTALRCARLTAVNLLFLLSLGVQPLLLSLMAAMACACTMGWRRYLPLLSLLIAFLLFLPFQWKAATTYTAYLYQGPHEPIAFARMAFARAAELLPAALGSLWLGLLLLLVPPAAWIALRGPGERTREAEAFRFFAFLVALALPAYTLFLGGLAEWMQHGRYFALFATAAVLLLASALAVLASWKRTLSWPALGVALLAAAISLAGARPAPRESLWAAFYEYLAASDIRSATGFMLTVGTASSFSLEAFPGTDFLYPPELSARVRLRSPWERRVRPGQVGVMMEEAAAKSPEPAELVLFGLDWSGSRPLGFFRLSGLIESKQLTDAGGTTATVLRIRNEGGRKATLRRVFNELEAQEQDEAFKPRIYLGLVALDLLEGKCTEARAGMDRVMRAVAAGQKPSTMFDLGYVESQLRLCGKKSGG
jgi:hypothetical protein